MSVIKTACKVSYFAFCFSCKDGSHIDWNKKGNSSINPSHYYAFLTVTQVSHGY